MSHVGLPHAAALSEALAVPEKDARQQTWHQGRLPPPVIRIAATSPHFSPDLVAKAPSVRQIGPHVAMSDET
jgi:hypothetical protein